MAGTAPRVNRLGVRTTGTAGSHGTACSVVRVAGTVDETVAAKVAGTGTDTVGTGAVGTVAGGIADTAAADTAATGMVVALTVALPLEVDDGVDARSAAHSLVVASVVEERMANSLLAAGQRCALQVHRTAAVSRGAVGVAHLLRSACSSS